MIAGLSASFLQCDHLENVTVDARTVCTFKSKLIS